jgi:hypothetical protein
VKSRIEGALFEPEVPVTPLLEFLDYLISIGWFTADQAEKKRIGVSLQ